MVHEIFKHFLFEIYFNIFIYTNNFLNADKVICGKLIFSCLSQWALLNNANINNANVNIVH